MRVHGYKVLDEKGFQVKRGNTVQNFSNYEAARKYQEEKIGRILTYYFDINDFKEGEED